MKTCLLLPENYRRSPLSQRVLTTYTPIPTTKPSALLSQWCRSSRRHPEKARLSSRMALASPHSNQPGSSDWLNRSSLVMEKRSYHEVPCLRRECGDEIWALVSSQATCLSSSLQTPRTFAQEYPRATPWKVSTLCIHHLRSLAALTIIGFPNVGELTSL